MAASLPFSFPGFEIMEIRNDVERIDAYAISLAVSGRCPDCQGISASVHSIVYAASSGSVREEGGKLPSLPRRRLFPLRKTWHNRTEPNHENHNSIDFVANFKRLRWFHRFSGNANAFADS